jgi:integrase
LTVPEDGFTFDSERKFRRLKKGMIIKRKQHWHLDVVINGVRYREALHTTDGRKAKELEKDRVAAIKAGKGISKRGREFARMPFNEAADVFIEERKGQVSERTTRLERERLKQLRAYFGARALKQIKADDIAAYQRKRRETVSGRTVNMEVGVLRQMMKRGTVWSLVAEDVRMDREGQKPIAQVLTAEEKKLLFTTAASNPEWSVVYCAAVLAVSTTCRSVELKHLRWRDVNFLDQEVTIARSKTEAGHRLIPLNGDAMAALARLQERAEANGATEPEDFIFPACERGIIDRSRPQKSWRTAWRALARETGRRAGREAAKAVLEAGGRIGKAKAAWKRAAKAYRGLRFHDLRHQAITELAEAGSSDATLMAVAGHMSRRMMEHYSHVRKAAKREILAKLESGLMAPPTTQPQEADSKFLN